MFHDLKCNGGSESKELITNLVLTCHLSNKYEDTSVFFSVEKPVIAYVKQIFFSAAVLFIIFILDISSFLLIFSVILVFTFLFFNFSCAVRRESVYLSVPIGLQIKAVFFLGNKSSTFIPWSSIQDFLIVEVISRQSVIYCLIVVIQDLDGVSYVTLFENTKPRLAVLEKVYKKLQSIVIEQKKRTNSQVITVTTLYSPFRQIF